MKRHTHSPAGPPRRHPPTPEAVAQSPVTFPEELPISARVRDIAEAITAHQVVIVAGETGSGKTTQLPKICLAMGRGLDAHIGVTQPRRIAATSVAARVAKELDVELGQEVGYKIRFADRTSRSTYVKFMTDGILLAELQGDPLMRAYDTIVLDEAHERSLNIDLLLGMMKRLLPRRPDLRVIISSATLETERYASFYGGAPVIQVSGRTFPVEVLYRPQKDGEGELSEVVANAVEEVTSLDPREDILIFLPGEREIHEVENELAGRSLRHTTVLPLYGRLAQSDQQRVFQTLPERRVVLATNVAETSLTIPGIVYVIDAGLARVNRYSARTGVTQLQIEPVSRASADQRKGRAGRVRSGVCLRLYEERDYTTRSAYTDPEILRVGLAGAILSMKSMGLGALEDFPFLDPPPRKAVEEGYRVLEELGALDAEGALTDIGRKLARLPLDPRIGRMILAGAEEGALREILILAAALGAQDPRERPLAAQKQADEAHRKFRDEASDFAGLLKLWHFYQDAQERLTRGQLRKLCRDNFLSHLRLREWSDVHRQLSEIAREMGLRPGDQAAGDEAVHRAILPGLLSRIGMWQPEKRVYAGARQTRFVLHPSSGLSRKPPAWIIAAELVETSQLFARMAARIDPAWLEPAAGALCKRSYGDPHWEQRPAQVVAKEQVSLYGLPIVRDRRVHYGPINPAVARRVFLLHALVRQEYAGRGTYQDHNRAVLEEAKRLRDKARRSDLLADEDTLLRFFEARIPEGIYSGKTFEAWRKEAEEKDPGVLHLSLADVLLDEAADLAPERFPDEIEIYGATLPLIYRFEPGEDDDGITVTIPLPLLPQVDPAVMEWTIPGWHEEKVTLLLDSLPKALRKELGGIREAGKDLASEHRPFEGPMLATLGHAVQERTGARVPPDAWDLTDLPAHLRFHFRLVDAAGKVVGEGRDLRELKERFGARAREAWSRIPAEAWTKEDLTSWSFDALPERVPMLVGGVKLWGYPALVDTGTSAALRVMPSREVAEEAMRGGLRRLLLLGAGSTPQKLEQQLPVALDKGMLAERVALRASPLAREGTPLGPRAQIARRALDEAFRLDDAQAFPRNRAAFQARLAEGRAGIGAALPRLARLAQEIATELERAEAALRVLSSRPVSRTALDDMRTQIAHLMPPGMFLSTPPERLVHLPRYLRAIQVRLERLPNGPQKDQAKADQVLPFWNNWLKHREGLRARGVPVEELEAFRWMIEELRVSTFAPELKTAVPVSSQRITEQWRTLTG
ncbi:ATP-dependent RNA helicase HrpA [Chondromyces apiculatus]|uniref:ATP-dependent helicase HrpA n=1 Tax=Chondromyces apiculatus DSM 436 TaxID=1192034 RepID=A0A017SWV4_9BACT|nr:ATP-dependent RNA helicase HrpA [Chondromyces apiculatus]EYF00816.1 ATP-dependent helicase HrpA [Chondromyces apiculatus DSM 436]